ncbi:hypothetical protein GCM10020258_13660 [Sphingomonas yabuuchiae]
MDLSAIVADIAAEMAEAPDRGTPADYIPALSDIDPQRFGIAIVEADGQCHLAGDAEESFSIQSISKVFALTLALGAVGDQLWRRVGREPSGTAFNSIVQLETEHGIPRNPFINAGAIVVADVILGNHEPREAIGELLRFVRALAGRTTSSSTPPWRKPRWRPATATRRWPITCAPSAICITPSSACWASISTSARWP